MKRDKTEWSWGIRCVIGFLVLVFLTYTFIFPDAIVYVGKIIVFICAVILVYMLIGIGIEKLIHILQKKQRFCQVFKIDNFTGRSIGIFLIVAGIFCATSFNLSNVIFGINSQTLSFVGSAVGVVVYVVYS